MIRIELCFLSLYSNTISRSSMGAVSRSTRADFRLAFSCLCVHSLRRQGFTKYLRCFFLSPSFMIDVAGEVAIFFFLRTTDERDDM